MAQQTTVISGPQVPDAKQGQAGATVIFAKATTYILSQFDQSVLALSASQQSLAKDVPGRGFIEGFTLHLTATADNTGTAVVAYTEDAPYSVLANVSLADTNGPTINLSNGYHLYLCSLYGQPKYGLRLDPGTGGATASVRSNLFSLVTGAGVTGGSFKILQDVPVALNNRTMVGALGNQDRGLTYRLTTDPAPTTKLYTTPPDDGAGNVAVSLQIVRVYRYWAKPAAQNAAGAPQAQYPDQYGIIRYLTEAINPTTPAPGTQEFFLNRLGNVIRQLIIVLRSNGSRATAEANLPDTLSLEIGAIPWITNVPVAEIRKQMLDRFGFDAPDGVLVLDFTADLLGNYAGDEMGFNYIYTQGLTSGSCKVTMTFPSGFGSTNNSATFITDDLLIPANVRMP